MTSRSLYRFTNASTSRAARLIVFALLGCMVAGIIGLPAPPPIKEISGTELFPCMDSPCGCKTAAQCWDKCCCHNDAQKIAWARAQGVIPPAFVVARFQSEQKQSAIVANPRSSSCAQEPGGNSQSSGCCSKNRTEIEKQCVTKPASTYRSRVVLWRSLQRCRGVDLVWTLLATGWIPDRHETVNVADPLLIEIYRIDDRDCESIIFSPDPPVPWFRPTV